MDKKSLLLVCGNKVVMDIKIRILERAGYSVKSALGCDQAREMLNEYSPDGIILESGPPEGCGIEFLRELVEDKKRDIPVMFLSDKREDEVDALQAGANDFLRKPYNFDVLLARVHMMIDKTDSADTATSSSEPKQRASDHNSTFVVVEEDKPQNRQDTAQLVKQSTARQKSSGRIRYKHIAGIAAACIAIMLVAGGIFLFLGDSPAEADIIDGNLPMANFPFETDQTPTASQTLIYDIMIHGIENIQIPAGTADIAINLENPASNPSYFLFELRIIETSELLYRSEEVKPGESVQQVTMFREMEKGVYKAVLMIYNYSLEGKEPMGSVSVDFIITAE